MTGAWTGPGGGVKVPAGTTVAEVIPAPERVSVLRPSQVRWAPARAGITEARAREARMTRLLISTPRVGSGGNVFGGLAAGPNR